MGEGGISSIDFQYVFNFVCLGVFGSVLIMDYLIMFIIIYLD
jgi:hypothetical protein